VPAARTAISLLPCPLGFLLIQIHGGSSHSYPLPSSTAVLSSSPFSVQRAGKQLHGCPENCHGRFLAAPCCFGARRSTRSSWFNHLQQLHLALTESVEPGFFNAGRCLSSMAALFLLLRSFPIYSLVRLGKASPSSGCAPAVKPFVGNLLLQRFPLPCSTVVSSHHL
ncbi:hypothetical protein EJB05_27926, partial [Eragrostis curvula]